MKTTPFHLPLLFCGLSFCFDCAFIDNSVHHYSCFGTGCITELVNHLNESITVEEIAKSFGVSGRYSRKIFAEHEGASPAQFVTDMRLRRAKTLLSCSDKSITEIAFSCGFYDGSHLTRVFKKHEGITPKEYKKRTHQ